MDICVCVCSRIHVHMHIHMRALAFAILIGYDWQVRSRVVYKIDVKMIEMFPFSITLQSHPIT